MPLSAQIVINEFPRAAQRRGGLFSILFLAALLTVPPTYAKEKRPFQVDDLLRLEQLGEVRFSRDGERLYFDKCGPYTEQAAFDMGYVRGETCSRIYAVDFDEDAGARPLFKQRPARGYRQLGESPDGRWLLFTENGREGYRLGAASTSGGRIRWFDVPVGNLSYGRIDWFGGDRFLIRSEPEAHGVDFTLGLRRVQSTLHQRQMEAFDGVKATASVLGSGAFLSRREMRRSLLWADAGSGRTGVIAEASSEAAIVSPDGDYVAILTAAAKNIVSKGPLDLSGGRAGQSLRLTVSRLGAPANVLIACDGCDVLPSSIKWRPDSKKLAYFARTPSDGWDQGAYYIADPETGETVRVSLNGAAPAFEFVLGERVLSPRWVDGVLVVRAYAQEQPGRADWFRVVDGEGANATHALTAAPETLLGTSASGLVVIAGASLWHVRLSGEATCLSCDDGLAISDWRRGPPFGGSGVVDDGPQVQFVARARRQGDHGQDSIIFVDLSTGGVSMAALPENTARIAAVSAATQRAAIEARRDQHTRLLVLGQGSPPEEIARINDHLSDIARGEPVKIRHQSVNGEKRFSWLLLPPGYKPGKPTPTVVNVYPGRVARETFTHAALDQAGALNDNVFTGAGFAVLYPSLPVDYAKTPREPLEGLGAEVDLALDAAIAAGYVDPDAVVLFGHSYGGYAVAGIIGQTNRYKAAIAAAGVYNLVSVYGAFDIRQRMAHEYAGPDMTYVHISESGQNGIGAPPWEDPERYLRNSPLMTVANVETPVMLISGDLDYIPAGQSEEYFTALARLGKDAVLVRYWGEEHVNASPPNIRDMWSRILDWCVSFAQEER